MVGNLGQQLRAARGVRLARPRATAAAIHLRPVRALVHLSALNPCSGSQAHRLRDVVVVATTVPHNKMHGTVHKVSCTLKTTRSFIERPAKKSIGFFARLLIPYMASIYLADMEYTLLELVVASISIGRIFRHG
jgi:hypothetical protein